MPTPQFEEWEIELHGRRVIYRIAGSGPPLVLIHGMLNSSSHWQRVALDLADEHTVIAPDLIGHGDSAAPRGDYSLGRTRPASATCWRRSASTARASSGTRSEAAWRCSSSTSSLSASSGWC